MICAYAVFCEQINYNSSNHISATDIFSSLSLLEPGTTQINFLIGISGVKKGKSESIEVTINLPNKKLYTAKWETPVSTDEYDVYNSVFNCSKIPFAQSGICTFVIRSADTKNEIGRRYLKVKVGTKDGVAADG